MNDLKIFKIRFDNNGLFCVSIVIAETIEEAKQLLIKDYDEYNVKIQIEEYEEVEEKGVALTLF